MIIQPKTRGFICTTAHPIGCSFAVQQQIQHAKKQPISDTPKRVLVIGASTGYGLASRITAAFSGQASTIGVFLEKPSTEKKTASAGWYNVAAFDAQAKKDGLYAKHIQGDAFSDEVKQATIACIQKELKQVDLVVYSLASPVRKVPQTNTLVRSTLKPIGEVYKTKGIDLSKNEIVEVELEPAVQTEIDNTVTVMGGEDWELWMAALQKAGVLASSCRTVAYSYIGTEITFPIYWNGTIGQAKKDLERAAHAINEQLQDIKGSAHVTVLKSVVTQASAAIPVLPLYLSIVFKKMRSMGLHEGTIEQTQRLFSQYLCCSSLKTDDKNRIRLDDWELREDIQRHCLQEWNNISTETLFTNTDYASYQTEFLNLFGFGFEQIDYQADVDHQMTFECEVV